MSCICNNSRSAPRVTSLLPHKHKHTHTHFLSFFLSIVLSPATPPSIHTPHLKLDVRYKSVAEIAQPHESQILIFINIHTCIHMTHKRIRICMSNVRKHTHTNICINTHVIYIHTHTYIHIYTCVHIIYTYMYIHNYVYIHT